MLTTVAATLTGEKTQYALEGSVFVGGAVIQWLRDAMGLISEARDSAYFASKVKDNDGVYVVPAFTGLGATYWDMYARGTIVGMTRASGRNHIIRAALESVAYQTEDILRAVSADAGIEMRDLKVDGGASANDLLMQFQSDISGVRVIRPASAEATARGAAYLAGISCGFWQSREELPRLAGSTCYSPVMEAEERERLLHGWHRAVRAARAWAEE
jgi:glycerol kinase